MWCSFIGNQIVSYWMAQKFKKTNKMTPFPLHTSGIETQSSGKDVITQCLSNSGWTISISHNLEIFSYIFVSSCINQLKLLNEFAKNPNPKSESMTLSSRRPPCFFSSSPPTIPWIGVDPMKFEIFSLMQYDINMKSTEDCAKIKFDCVQTIHFKSFKWNNDEMLQKWSHHSQDSKGINIRALPSSEASSLSFVYRKPTLQWLPNFKLSI